MDMTRSSFLIEEQLGMLDCDVVIAEVIDPTSVQLSRSGGGIKLVVAAGSYKLA